MNLSDLDLITFGIAIDMMTEHGNDSFEYAELATDEDIANF